MNGKQFAKYVVVFCAGNIAAALLVINAKPRTAEDALREWSGTNG